MARRSLKPQLNQIRAWVRQGRTDAWIAHQLEVSATELREFRKQHDLTPDDDESGTGEVDLRDEIEAEVEAATAEEPEEAAAEDADESESDKGEEGEGKRGGGRGGRSSGGRSRGGRGGGREKDSEESEGSEEDEGSEGGDSGEGGGQRRRRRRRGRRGGRGRRREIEATFDHGERDGYGLWLDASVKDNPVYAEHWAGKREVTVRIEADQIVIRRAGSGDDGNGGDSQGD